MLAAQWHLSPDLGDGGLRPSKLDPYKGCIHRLPEHDHYGAALIARSPT